jgi:fumarate hydratase class II
MKYVESSKRVFMNTNTRFPRRIIWALALIKYSAAKVNNKLGLLDDNKAMGIIKASEEVMNGLLDDKVIVDVFQTGSGTGINMNLNELIAERASEIVNDKVHPNDHVNMGQSSNDTVPTAIRIASVSEIKENLIPSLNLIINELGKLVEGTKDVIKPGRTHLRDALPVTMAQEFSGYLSAFSKDLKLLEELVEYSKELPIGGTAVGTGVNSHPKFAEMVIDEINARTSLGFRKADNRFRAMKLLTDLLYLSSAMRAISVNLLRMCQDIRLMFSGPLTGLNEIDIPSQEEVAGSSIMPGKTNPVTVEASMLVASQVIGLDHSNQVLSTLGEFELSMGIPLMGYNVVLQSSLLSEALSKMSNVVLSSIKPNKERLYKLAESSPALITVLSPVIGYDKASQIGKRLSHGVSIREALRELGYNEEEINRILDLKRLVKVP